MQNNEIISELKKDPSNQHSCSTRRRMAWACLFLTFCTFALVAFVPMNEKVAKTMIWASSILCISLVMIYALSRTVLDKTVLEAMKILERKITK